MIYLIEIPHRRPANKTVFEGTQDLIWAAEDMSRIKGDDLEFDNAADVAHYLCEDCHSYLLICDKTDLELASNYSGHQDIKVRNLVKEIKNELTELGILV